MTRHENIRHDDKSTARLASQCSDGIFNCGGVANSRSNQLRATDAAAASSVIRTSKDKDDRLSQWVTRLAARSHPNIAAVALANKTTRMAWAMLKNGTDYQPAMVTS
jgi:hypothetical protein